MTNKLSTVTIGMVAILGIMMCSCKNEPHPPANQNAAAPIAIHGTLSYDFEAGPSGWSGTDTPITVETVAKQRHAGNASLKITGTAGEGRWNFVRSPHFVLEPGKTYKLHGWMLVEMWDNKSKPPHLKCASMQGSKWLSNAFTNKYDVTKMNEWQELSASFTVPSGTTEGFIALEKGTQEPITGTIYLDDIGIEILK